MKVEKLKILGALLKEKINTAREANDTDEMVFLSLVKTAVGEIKKAAKAAPEQV